MRVCLDTNAYSRLMGGHAPLTQLLESAEEVLVDSLSQEQGAGLGDVDHVTGEIGREAVRQDTFEFRLRIPEGC